MKKNKILVVIPARYGSTRFPGKPLALLAGKEIILRVCERVAQTGFDLAVATDDERILNTVEIAGFQGIMTSAVHPSGTDRVREAMEKISQSGHLYDVVINVQGDEPFINPSDIKNLSESFSDAEVKIATLVKEYPKDGCYEGLENPNVVKVEKDSEGFAITFSRNVIPFQRGVEKEDWPSHYQYFTHVGIYAYRSKTLKELTSLPQSALEKAESLEQLRWLDAGYRIKAILTKSETIGIDTPGDLQAAEAVLKSGKNLLIL